MKEYSLQQDRIPNELALQLKMLSGEVSATNEMNVNVDWEKFVDYAFHHRIFPNLYNQFAELHSFSIPDSVYKILKQETIRNQFHMLALQSEMIQMYRSFQEHGIRMLVLKGPLLAQALYGDVSKRTSSDLDVLISLEDLERAEKLLVMLGFEKDDYIETVLQDWKWRHHHVSYIHPVKHIKFELHWRLHPGPGKESSFSELWSRRQELEIGRNSLCMLGNEDLFCFLVVHGARHGWSRLRWLLDIRYIVTKELDWETITLLLRKHSNKAVGGQALILAANLLDMPLQRGMEPLLLGGRPLILAQQTFFYLENMIHLHDDVLPKHVQRYHQKYSRAIMSRKNKIIYALSCLYPYPEDKKTLPLPVPLHFLYFPLRPFLSLWRRIKKMQQREEV